MNASLTAQQQALLGCGEFYGTDCERDGLDLFSTEASIVIQSFVGFEGSSGNWDLFNGTVAQPGTLGFVGGPVATRPVAGVNVILDGARGPGDPGYDPLIDGRNTNLDHPLAGRRPGPDGLIEFTAGNDDVFTGPDGVVGTADDGPQQFANEMAAVSFNAMMVIAGLSLPPDADNDQIPDRPPDIDELDNGFGPNGVLDIPSPGDNDMGPDGIRNTLDDPFFRLGACSLRQPQFCKNLEAFLRGTRVQRNDVRAGGSSRFGRRDFQWHEGAPLTIRYKKANVLGFSTDFTEDRTKSNWSLELTWVENLPFLDSNQADGLANVDTYNLTISVDRPTFVNFLNANRTLFINSQWFFQYVDGYRSSFTSNGPWNILATLTVTTGYFQDRLLPTVTLVYDKNSNSGAFLPSVSYRFTENFSATVGMALFAGRVQRKTMSLVPPASGNRVGPGAYNDYSENGLSVVRERDEAFLRIKYTF